MATAVDEINRQMMQPYSPEANVNQMADRVQAMRRRGAGRGARLTGSGAAPKAPLATAAQLNPRAIKRGKIAGQRRQKSMLEYARGIRGRFFKKRKSYAQFLSERGFAGTGKNRVKSSTLGDFDKIVAKRAGQKGGKRSRTGRERREAIKLQNMYKNYVKRFRASASRAISAV
jgi:hypothetical protein|tara:strand:- start:717 stop:1235 length:519 start_codon:yes stop_codon:yes gene_type:complete